MAPSSAPAKFSLALSSKKAPAPANKKRPHSTLQDSDDEDAAPQAQTVSHFDVAAGGAIDSAKKATDSLPLVISSRPNRDWRAESQRKRQKSALPHQQNANATAEVFEEQKPVYGLNVISKEASPSTTEEPNGTTTTHASEGDTGAAAGDTTNEPAKPKTDEQLAIEALTGSKPKSELVLPAVETEEQAFRRDYETAPEMASLNEYEAVPVEEFGAALLRGMGWKEGEAIGRRKGQKAVQPRLLEKRPALLGIGAKADAAIGEEMGTWGKGAKSKRKGPETYNPVVLRNAKTGEQLTEQELQKKMEDQKNAEQEVALSKRQEDSDRRSGKTSGRHRYDDYDSERREKDRRRDDRDRGRDRENGHRYKSSRRHRSRSESEERSSGRRKYDGRSDYDRKTDRKRSPRRHDRDEAHSSRHSRHARDRSRDRHDSDRRRR